MSLKIRRFRTAAVLVLVLTLARSAAAQKSTVRVIPVPPAVTPHVLAVDLRELARTAPVRPWKPGDPVRIIGDMQGQQEPSPAPPGSASSGTNSGSVPPDATDRDLRELPAAQQWKPGDPVREMPDLRETPRTPAAPPAAGTWREIPQRPTPTVGPTPVMGANFDGIPATGFLPPDTNGDVGPNHYVQIVNTALAIYDKAGTLLAGPVNINSLWSGFGGPCQTQNNGDPIVRYDHLADRWLVSQFAIFTNPNHECIAISRSGDPVSGGWFLYAFPTTDGATNVFPDYPKIGVWPDAYYMGTQRGFPSSGLDVWAFERAAMLAGLPAQMLHFAVGAPSLFLLPSDLEGPAPPAGTPNYFVRQVDGEVFGGADRLEVWAFTANWATASGSFVQNAVLPTAPFDSVLCGGGLIGTCVPQPGTAQRLESLSVWAMWRPQYRNFASHQTIVVNHTVDANGADLAGVRWYELRRPPGGGWSIFQQGTHAPDTTHRWMGSTAMDKAGNIAQGFSVSSSSVFPGIRAAVRSPGDPAGTLPTEITIVNGGGSQTDPSSRWGNYSSMDVDPVDDCTFWYTNEYYATTSAAGWRTRIASFRIPSCTTTQGGWVITNNDVPNFPSWAAAPGARPQSGDFNADGRHDIVVTGVASFNTIPVAFSNGDGSFNVTNAPGGNFPGWTAVPSAKTLVGDYNGDGRADLAITGPSDWNTLPVALSNGDGTFTIANEYVGNFADWAATPDAKVLTGDFNGDGRTDIALTGASGWNTLPVAFSNGNGTFTITNSNVGNVGNFAVWSAAANVAHLASDYNGDGRTDIALTGPSGWNTLPVAFSNGDGSFTITNSNAGNVGNFAVWSATANVVHLASDYNGDGRTDIALTGASGWNTLPVAFSNGDGTFTITNAGVGDFAIWSATANVKALPGRYDSGNRADIALTGASGWTSIPVAFSNGDGLFNVNNAPAPSFAEWASISTAIPLAADFNGDGRTDIALTGPSGWTSVPIAFSGFP